MARIRSLITKIKRYNPDVDVAAIRSAYSLARKYHIDQYRMSGEDFVSHPIEVADILADLGMDTTTIVAALLHDVVEDTDISLDELTKEVGADVTSLIDGVTKLGQIEFKSREEEQAENLRKMFIAMAKDIRVILIKLADRLHNMRTIRHLEYAKQVKKARETLEIYAPLAHRLGIMSLKWELEDLSFQVLEPKKYEQIQRMVAERRSEREEFLKTSISKLKKELKALGIEADIGGRPKHFYSIYEKMVKKGRVFSEIYDLFAVRVIVESIKDCYGALGAIHAMWTPIPGRFKDYIAMPKFNMYQSLHTTVIGPMGKPLEIQIRTKQMHRTAEYGIAAHWRYKEGTGTREGKFDERLSWLRQMLEWQSELKDPREFMESLKIDLFEDEVYVFTPKGDVINLPKGATPLDFAYTIHTDVGHSCIGAKVNNQIVPLEYKLRTGDFVEILTTKTATGPSKDWLKMVKSSRAKNKIRQWFNKESREDSQASGREMLQKELRKLDLGLKSSTSISVLEEIARELNFKGVEDVFASIGAGKTSVKQVATRISEAHEKEDEKGDDEAILEELTLKFPQKKKRSSSRTGVIVKGIDDMLVRIAHCCNPVPYDDIIGFVTRGRGVSVHRVDCINAKKLVEAFPERIMETSWDTNQPAAFQVEVEVEALDRPKLLRDVSTVLGDAGVNILSASVSTSRQHVAMLKFVFEVGNLSHLHTIIGNIKRVPAVYDVYRVEPNIARREKIETKTQDSKGKKK